ncbi:MAG: transcriptional regulator NrdR [Acidobacteriota bacterium]
MKCPHCGEIEDKVIDSRIAKDGTTIRRRRECIKCGRRFTTYEKIEELPFMVIKKDGRREPFNRQKLLLGIRKACEKRPISVKIIEGIANEIEVMMQEKQEREISTSEIGKFVMEKLKKLDKVAYVRFASVYREFKDVDQFMDELSQLLKEK